MKWGNSTDKKKKSLRRNVERGGKPTGTPTLTDLGT